MESTRFFQGVIAVVAFRRRKHDLVMVSPPSHSPIFCNSATHGRDQGLAFEATCFGKDFIENFLGDVLSVITKKEPGIEKRTKTVLTAKENYHNR